MTDTRLVIEAGKITLSPEAQTPPSRPGKGAGGSGGQGAGGPGEKGAGGPGESRSFWCRFVRAGRVRAAGNRPGDYVIEAQALEAAWQAGLFEQRAVFLDHSGYGEHPSLRDLVGVTEAARLQPDPQGVAVEGLVRLYPSSARTGELLDEVLHSGAPDVGLSLVLWPEFTQPGGGIPRETDHPRRITGIRHIESIDIVFEPAADGRVLHALSSGGQTARIQSTQKEKTTMEEETVQMNAAPESGEGLAGSWLQAMAAQASALLVNTSGLPAASRQRLAARSYANPGEVQQAIDDELQFLATLAQDSTVQMPGLAPRSPQIQVGLSAIDQVRQAAEALFLGQRPASGIQPLSGIRELYTLLSGDYEMAGVFHPERIRFSNVDSSTMAGLVANALNKAVVNLFQEYPRWWEAIVMQESFSTLQQVKWITLGGVGELPTVAEGAAYTELTWDDQTETSDFTKKGGYLGITLEAIDKDDTRKVQSAPRALAQAAWLTLSKSVSAIFTANTGTGPLVSDGTALFTAGHGNLGTTALSLTSYAAARTAMRKMTELNSAERLGALTAPKFLLVPPDLEITALQVLASQFDYTYALANAPGGPDNVFAEGSDFQSRINSARRRVIVVDLWTDTNNWAAAADPRLYPTIGLGFRYGSTPEIFSVASPTAGLMFTNDTLPVKVRFFYAVGPVDWRGLYKANVA